MKYFITKLSVLAIAFVIFQACGQTTESETAQVQQDTQQVEQEVSVENIVLTQVPGDFETKSLVLKEGLYQFEIANDGIDHEVGFVLVPKGKYDEADHIKTAYVTAPVAEGSSSLTSVVSLEAGEYEYFCPLNPTPKYALTVK